MSHIRRRPDELLAPAGFFDTKPKAVSDVPKDVRILVVDDEPDVCEAIALQLRAASWQVDVAADGREALAAIDGTAYDVVILDERMPGMAGNAVLDVLAGDDDAPAVIMLSAKWEVEARVKSLDLGAIDYVPKPFAAAELLARVRAALRTRSRLRRVISLSFEDPLTGLGNRRAFEQALQQEVARARRHARPLSLLLADADGLKQVNDELGHGAGDRLLRALAEAIRRTVRVSDHAARIGGDEFAVILPETPRDKAATVGQRLAAALRRAPYVDDRFASASFGIASVPDDATDGATLMHAADAALYQAKALLPASRRG